MEYELIDTMSLPGIEANSPGIRERTLSPLGCKLFTYQRKEDISWEPLLDGQEAEASVGKSRGSLVDDGLKTEPLEEYCERRTGHTTAYDDYLGHACLSLASAC